MKKAPKSQNPINKITTGLKIESPTPPNVLAYKGDYEKYLEHYRLYVKEVESIRIKLSSRKGVRVSSAGVPYTIEKEVVLTTTVKEVDMDYPDGETGVPTYTLGLNQTEYPYLGEKFPASAKADPKDTGKAGPTVAKASPAESKTPKVNKGKRVNVRRELKAVKLAAELATSISKAEKVAARAGRAVVKTKDGWNLVVKGGKPQVPTESAVPVWERNAKKQFFADRKAFVVKVVALGGGLVRLPESQISADVCIQAIKANGLEAAFT